MKTTITLISRCNLLILTICLFLLPSLFAADEEMLSRLRKLGFEYDSNQNGLAKRDVTLKYASKVFGFKISKLTNPPRQDWHHPVRIYKTKEYVLGIFFKNPESDEDDLDPDAKCDLLVRFSK